MAADLENMEFIWYNPDLDSYQRGTMREYDLLLSISSNSDRFDILYEFSHTSDKIINKILQSLNHVRESEMAVN